MSYRELWVLISKMPQDSWTQAALRDDPNKAELPAGDTHPGPMTFGPWSQTDMLLAELVDAVNRVWWWTASPHSEKKIPHPKPVSRPGVDRAKVRAISPEAQHYLNSLRAPKGA